jgi:hypothetical protein
MSPGVLAARADRPPVLQYRITRRAGFSAELWNGTVSMTALASVQHRLESALEHSVHLPPGPFLPWLSECHTRTYGGKPGLIWVKGAEAQ